MRPLLTTLLIVSACTAQAAALAAVQGRTVVEGVADLRDEGAALAAGVRLDGAWRFAADALLPPTAPDAAFDRAGDVPGVWNAALERPDRPAGHGTGTYRTRLLLPPDADDLALRLTTFGTAWVMYADGTRIAAAGELPDAAGPGRPGYQPVVAALPRAADGELVLTLQIANHHFARGGPWELVWIGDRVALQTQREDRARLASFLAGAFGVAGLYHLMLFLARRADRAALAFALLCFAVAARVLTVDDVQITQLLPWLGWAEVVRLEYLSMIVLLAAAWAQLRCVFPEEVPAAVAWGIASVTLAFAPLVLLTDTAVFTAWLWPLQALVVLSALLAPPMLLVAAARRREGARLFLAGVAFLGLAGIHDVLLYTVRDMPSLELLGGRLDLQPLGLLVFIASQASVLALRSARTVAGLEAATRDLGEARDALDRYARELEARVAARTAELEAANRELERFARSDCLTGIGNRRLFDEELRAAWQDHRRRGASLGLVLVDLDRFKRFNDALGHQQGDAALRAVASALVACATRPRDTVARYGGEELAVILPDTDEAGAMHLAEKMRAAVEALAIAHPGNEHGVVTISAGVAALEPASAEEPDLLVAIADTALYDAKNVGRNRCRTASTVALAG